jgi:hypothetical protein
MACELRQFDCGTEMQLLVNDELYAGRMYRSREEAIGAAADRRERLRQAGWSAAP